MCRATLQMWLLRLAGKNKNKNKKNLQVGWCTCFLEGQKHLRWNCWLQLLSIYLSGCKEIGSARFLNAVFRLKTSATTTTARTVKTGERKTSTTLLIPELFISFGSAVGPFTIKLLEQGQVWLSREQPTTRIHTILHLCPLWDEGSAQTRRTETLFFAERDFETSFFFFFNPPIETLLASARLFRGSCVTLMWKHCLNGTGSSAEYFRVHSTAPDIFEDAQSYSVKIQTESSTCIRAATDICLRSGCHTVRRNAKMMFFIWSGTLGNN